MITPFNSRDEINEAIINEILVKNGFKVSHTSSTPKVQSKCIDTEELELSEKSRGYLQLKNISKLYTHQALAVKEASKGQNVCVSTSTSSGKSEIFFLSAMEELSKRPSSKILVVYPMRALNSQQNRRWNETGLKVGQIDGEVTGFDNRLRILRESQVIVMTPDVVHAFLLGKANKCHTIQDFIRNISMVVVDEAHLYNGVFGTNSAYMFRRLNYMWHRLRNEKGTPQYITASATLPDPSEHSKLLTGATSEFVNIGAEKDGSPSEEKVTFFVEPEQNSSSIGVLTQAFLPYKVKSITFVESRKATGENVEMDNTSTGIYPFRAGFEDETRKKIAEVLENNESDLNGVISTSALEIGIDIQSLNLAIIANMPYDRNSYWQRVGRVGRYNSGKSYVIVVKDYSFRSALLFDPEFGNFNINRVLSEYKPTLYLDDKNVQFHQMTFLFGNNDECEAKDWLASVKNMADGADYFPDSFMENCCSIINGQIPESYERINSQQCPHFVYGLRYFGLQYEIQPRSNYTNPNIPLKEEISRVNLIKEAYPGAIRRSQNIFRTVTERVISKNRDIVFVEEERNQYLSTSAVRRTMLYPNYLEGAQYGSLLFGDGHVRNLGFVEMAVIFGYKEGRKGTNIANWKYFKYDNDNRYQHSPFIPEPLSTTATIIFHPALNNRGIQRDKITDILFQTFISLNTFDPQDISKGSGASRYSVENIISQGDYFIAFYDASSLNLTHRFIENKGKALVEMFDYLKAHKDVIIDSVCGDVNNETDNAIDQLCESFTKNIPEVLNMDETIKTKVYSTGSEASYINPDDDSHSETKCTIVGRNSNDLTYNILIISEGNADVLYNIQDEYLASTPNSQYETLLLK